MIVGAVTVLRRRRAPRSLSIPEGNHYRNDRRRGAPRSIVSPRPTDAKDLTIVNTGTSDDRLIAASSPVAEKSEPHSTIDDNGVMRMRPLAGIEVKAGERVELKPGGMHLMLTGLKAPLKLGQSFPLTLTFEKAGAVSVTVAVEKAGATGGHAMPGM